MNDSESPVEPTAPNGEPPDNGLPAASASPWWRRPAMIFLIVAVALAAGGVTFALTRGGDDNKISVVGTMVLVDGDASWRVGEPCKGSGDFSDVHDGTAVTVKNEKNAIIGTGALTAPFATSSTKCLFVIIVRDVPRAVRWDVDVSHQGKYSLESHAGLKDRQLSVALTLSS